MVKAIRDPMPEEGPPWGPDPIGVGERQGSALDLRGALPP